MRQLRRNVSEAENVYRGQSRLPQKQDIITCVGQGGGIYFRAKGQPFTKTAVSGSVR